MLVIYFYITNNYIITKVFSILSIITIALVSTISKEYTNFII